jgi:hypothetical protein
MLEKALSIRPKSSIGFPPFFSIRDRHRPGEPLRHRHAIHIARLWQADRLIQLEIDL